MAHQCRLFHKLFFYFRALKEIAKRFCLANFPLLFFKREREREGKKGIDLKGNIKANQITDVACCLASLAGIIRYSFIYLLARRRRRPLRAKGVVDNRKESGVDDGWTVAGRCRIFRSSSAGERDRKAQPPSTTTATATTRLL